jgi:hypothetical protein
MSQGKFAFELLEVRRFLSGGGDGGELPDWFEVQDSPYVLAGRDGHVEGSLGRFEWNLPSADQYTVTIDWGDGRESAGQIVVNDDGSFSIFGVHDYAADKLYMVLASVQAADGARSAAGAFAVAHADPIDLIESYDLFYGDGWYGPPDVILGYVPNTFCLGLFYDADHPAGDPGTYSLTVDWGDGTTPTSTEFTTLGGDISDIPAPYHFYAKNGDYQVNISVARDDLIIRSSATAHVWYDFELVPIERPIEGPLDQPVEASGDVPANQFADPAQSEPFAGPSANRPTVADEVFDADRINGILDETPADFPFGF